MSWYGTRKLESSDFEAVKALDSSFRWNDEQKFPAIESLKFGALRHGGMR
jgi:hypothetical protein